MELLCRRGVTPPFELPTLTERASGQLLQFTLAVVNFILNIAVTGGAMHSGVCEVWSCVCSIPSPCVCKHGLDILSTGGEIKIVGGLNPAERGQQNSGR
ncbi:hypothetical protein CDAR_192011 [Caerostris darwini]|uniref:Uncharacterized protein n=1 Tax=Caerostris darwini TaxID=1538125 RepID=A0AAV4NP61_9ARAC|nr:hypothetical protein CDAR_192011 [Caerostris darwini]